MESAGVVAAGRPKKGTKSACLPPMAWSTSIATTLVPPERGHHPGERTARGDEPQSGPLARLDQSGVDASAQRPHHRMERHPLGHRRPEHLPAPEVRGGDEEPLSPGERALHGTEVVHLHLGEELGAARPEGAERIRHRPRHVRVGGTGERASLVDGPLGKGAGEVVQRDAPADAQRVGAGGDGAGERVDGCGRKRLEETHQHSGGRPGKDSRLDARGPLHHAAC
jgi:hypothetical protein